MVFKGDYSTFGYKVETAFDETPVEGEQQKSLGIIPNVDFEDTFDYRDFYNVNNTTRDIMLEAQGKLNSGATVPFTLQNGRALGLAMGTEVFSAGTPNTHTLSGGRTIPSMCLEAVYLGDNEFLRYLRGAKINTLSLEAVEGGEVRGDIEYQAARSEKSTNDASTVETSTDNPYMFYDSQMTIDGYDAFDMTTWKWSIKNNLSPKHVCRQTGGQYARFSLEGKREYEITANIIIRDIATYNTEIYDKLMAGTVFDTSISMIRTSGTDDATITASNCTIRSAPHNIPESGEDVEVPVTIKPRSCSAVVRDSLAAYNA